MRKLGSLWGWKNPQSVLIQRKLSEAAWEPQEDPNAQKLIKIAIIGVPNSGKSTFINKIINHRVIEDSKIHSSGKTKSGIVFSDLSNFQ